jgi:hypothetical protein
MTSCDSIFAYQGRMWVRCRFAGRWHPERLAEAYGAVPSVDYAEPNGQWNNRCNVYPYKRETGFTFLVRYGWGDCPAGCIHNRFSYFRVIDGQIVWIGSWVRFDDPKPEWWEEGMAGWACFHGLDGCPE